MRSFILLSGGLDSYIVSHFRDDARPIYVTIGNAYEERDLSIARSLCNKYGARPLTIIEGPPLGGYETATGYIPFRNLQLMTAVAAYAGTPCEIIISAPLGELVFDQQPKYFRAVERVLPGVKVTNGAQGMTKAALVGDFLFSAPELRESLHETRSCYHPTSMRCGKCSACLKRFLAMSANGVHEEYDADPLLMLDDLHQVATLTDVRRYGVRAAYAAWMGLRRAREMRCHKRRHA